MAVTDGTDGTEGTVCPQRCTKTAAEYQHLDCTLPAHVLLPKLCFIYLFGGFLFLLARSTRGRSQPEHCSWMESVVECPNGKGELGRV